MTAPIPFGAQAPGYSIAVTTTASSSQALPSIGNTVRLVNEGPNHAYVAIGTGPQTATVPAAGAAATCMEVMAGTDITLTIPSSALQNISAITKTGTAMLNVYVGEGQ